jgi:hypothetical protein
MGHSFQHVIFVLYEQRRLRNWFYTLAFVIFVPTGLRFAILAWEYGDSFDKPLSIFAGLLIGITAVVTLLRIWTVPPRPTLQAKTVIEAVETGAPLPNASQIYAAARQQAARNREIARGAAALGTTHGWPRDH